MILNGAARKRSEGEPAGGRKGWPGMKRAFALCALVAVAACGRASDEKDGQPEIVSNIVEDAVPEAEQVVPPVNAVAAGENRVEAEIPPSPGPVPAALQGRWTGLSDDCGDRAAPLELNIGPDSLIFHESVGQVEKVTRGEGGAMRVTAAFTGEGESWTRTLTLKPAADTLTIVNDGTATVRKRC
jgi:hypothetical protein